MYNKLLTGILAVSMTTAFSSCQDLLPTDETDTNTNNTTQNNTDNSTDTSSDTNTDTDTSSETDTTQTYEQLLDSVSIDVMSSLNCTLSGCHTGNTTANFVVTDAQSANVESGIVDYIEQDSSANVAKLKSKPTGGDGHLGGSPLTDADLQTSWNTLVDKISMTSPVLTLVTDSGCNACHAAETPFNVKFVIGSTPTIASILSGLDSAISLSTEDIATYPTNTDHTGNTQFSWTTQQEQAWADLVNAL